MAEGGDPEVLMRSLSEDADFNDEMKLSYGKYGVEGLLEKIDAWKNEPVKIAVTNISSTFIIVSLRSLYSGDRELWLWKILLHQPSARLDPGR